MESSYSQKRRAKTVLDNRKSISCYIDRSLQRRTGTVLAPRSEESKQKLNSTLDSILKTEKEFEDNEKTIVRRKINSQKTPEEIEFHNFIDEFANTGKKINERFDELLNKSQQNIDDLKLTTEKLVECERTLYRTEMGLDEKYEEFIEKEKEWQKNEAKRTKHSEFKSFFTTSPYS